MAQLKQHNGCVTVHQRLLEQIYFGEYIKKKIKTEDNYSSIMDSRPKAVKLLEWQIKGQEEERTKIPAKTQEEFRIILDMLLFENKMSKQN